MEGVEEKLARIGGNAYLMDGVTRFSTVGVDLGEKPSVIRLFVSTTNRKNASGHQRLDGCSRW